MKRKLEHKEEFLMITKMTSDFFFYKGKLDIKKSSQRLKR